MYLWGEKKVNNHILNRSLRDYLLLIEELSEFSLHLLSGFFAGELVLTDDVLEVEVSGNHVPGGHDVVVVDSLDEWLDLGSPLDLLLAHAASHLQGVSLDAGNQSVRELLILQRERAINDRTGVWVRLPSFHRRAV